MSEDDNQNPSGLVAVGTKALAVRSATLVKRGLALAESLQSENSGRPSDEKLTPSQVKCLFEAIDEDFRSGWGHVDVGNGLFEKGDWEGAISAFRKALRSNPNLAEAHSNLGLALRRTGDFDGAIAEYREALRLNPKLAAAHCGLGVALGNKGDLNGMISEEREALRLNPNSARAHYNLGAALERKQDLRESLQEYRIAYELNPEEPDYRKAYERLMKEMQQ